jgi:Ca2+-binding EF-hand superfamily protein
MNTQMIKKAQYDTTMRSFRLRKSDKEIIDRMFILFDETGEAEVDWKCFLSGLCLLMKNASFEEKLMYGFRLFDDAERGIISHQDCEMVLKSMNETISWFGDDNLDDDDLEKMIEQHFEAHPSVNEENMYEYEDNLSAISKNPRLESIIKKVNNKKSTYADIKDSLKK